jgi:Domain of unknown function (DUF1844)
VGDQPSKISIDDDWKSQVEQEKQMATADSGSQVSSDNESAQAPPDASFETLVTMLFTQAMAALGQVPGEDGKPMPINKAFAKHFIDTLEMLGEKTKGNLSDAESKLHSEVLHVMRMTFVSVKPPK